MTLEETELTTYEALNYMLQGGICIRHFQSGDDIYRYNKHINTFQVKCNEHPKAEWYNYNVNNNTFPEVKFFKYE